MRKYLVGKTEQQTLITITGVMILLFILKYALFEDTSFLFMLWNVVLAWIPLLALFIIAALPEGVMGRLIGAILYIVWFFFYPNTPYLLTDLIHLRNMDIGFNTMVIQQWIKYTILLLGAYLGILLSFYGLYPIYSKLRDGVGKSLTNIITVLFFIISAFGIYLGRFRRLNSWEIITNPMRVVNHAIQSLKGSSLSFILLFALIQFLIFYSLYSLRHSRRYRS